MSQPYLVTPQTVAPPPDRASFVGRAGELADLERALDEAVGGSARLALVMGGPGIGKTRLAAEVSDRARRRGAAVLVGRCAEEEGAPAYWPWRQVLRTYAAREPAAVVRAEMGSSAGDLARIAPELCERLPDLAAPPALEAAQARFRLFDGFAGFLRAAARRRPLVVVLDDLHGADLDSLRLLAFVGREIGEAPLLVLGTYRDSEVRHRPTVSETLAEVGRQWPCTLVPLRGFGEAEVARFIALTAGVLPTPGLVATVHRQTDGNPFLVTEVVRYLTGRNALVDPDALHDRALEIPPAVRDVIAHRVACLGDGARRLLETAAVIGPDFDVEILRCVGDSPAEALEVVLRDATAASIIVPEPPPGRRYRFVHALIRETLYDGLDVSRRMALHRRIGETIETVHAANLEAHVDALARHFYRAATRDDGERALAYAVRAAERATAVYAHGEAADHYQSALRILDLIGGDDTRRADVLLALGELQMRAGEPTAARETLTRTAALARAIGSAAHLARAAVAFAGPLVIVGDFDTPAVTLLEEALAALPPDDSILRAKVLGRLAMTLTFSNASAQRIARCDEAVAIGTRLGDLETLAFALGEKRGRLCPTAALPERLADASAILRRAEESGSSEVALEALAWRVLDSFELGDLAEVDATIERLVQQADALRHPVFQYRTLAYRATRAFVAGRLDEAQTYIARFLALGQRVLQRNATGGFAAHMCALLRLRGPMADLAAFIPIAPERGWSTASAWQAARVTFCVELGRHDEARHLLDHLAVGDFGTIQSNFFWVSAAALLAESCAALDDAARAAVLYEQLLPFDGRNVMLGLAGSFGASARFLGLLATTLGRLEDAERHFEDALAMNGRMGAVPFVALTQHAYAEMLLRRGDGGDAARARLLAVEAAAAARRIGASVVEERALALAERIGTVTTSPRVAPPVCLLRREAAGWVLGREDAPFRVRDTLGMRYLATLLASPGRSVPAVKLVARSNGRTEAAPLDDALDDALEIASETGSFGSAARLARLADAVEGQRDDPRVVERARLNVTKRIRRTIRKIAAFDAKLARHLADRVKTGRTCVYRPAPDERVRWVG